MTLISAPRERANAIDGEHTPVLGLGANWKQFALLVVVNGFVGAMAGLERTVLPVLASRQFGIVSATAALSFIAAFGLAKAFANLASGWLADRVARRPVLVAGWLIVLPVPALILWAPSWSWIVAANLLLGANQGLAWSTTIIMKVDLVGPQRRGLAMGLNEFAGYVALSAAAVVSGYAATQLTPRQGLAYPGFAIAVTGLVLSLWVRETSGHARAEAAGRSADRTNRPALLTILRRSLWSDPALFSISQAGLVNNLNDGLAWGLFPLLFAAGGLGLRRISLLAALYPAVWGLAQLATGPLSDAWGRKWLIVAGMLAQGAALMAVGRLSGWSAWAASLTVLGIGTALVYPTLVAAISDVAHPSWRGVAVGVYRLWRDLGYVAGALIAGLLADTLGIAAAIEAIGVLTVLSGVVAAIRLPETLHSSSEASR